MCPYSIEDVGKQSCHQDISMERDDPSTQASTEKVKKKCRGPTRCENRIHILEEKIEIRINETSQPIGPKSVKLSSF